MRASRQASDAKRAAARGVLAALLALSFPAPAALAAGDAPRRVVSMNLCTDQIAMLVAAPGQLVSVSYLAARPDVSLMSGQTAGLALNHGLAEEILRLDPDLVIAGTYTRRATVNLLRRLGRRVEEFAPANSFADIRENVRRMGDLLGRKAQAARLIAAFDAEAGALAAAPPDEDAPVLGSFGANSYTTGGGTLENEIVGAAGLRHLGEELEITGTTRLPLEALVLADPDYVLLWERSLGDPSRAAEILRHPVLDARFGGERRVSADSRAWICGTPLTLEAVAKLRAEIGGQASLPRERVQ
ncbi:ABC transporter substrate-binding protein [Stappia indica]|uniref:ABC transporter substrate-binding protein n=1 Tax=Stappia indica TaxID=538381 RepID=A0A857CCC0_9HYPH|nr:ABC transporter substrate-binding protein [Stappia indica]QGZ36505.1 ABC transporter substrate-binding protein [Stappia indica]